MKTKHKRLIIIGCCIAWGMVSLSLVTWGESLLGNGIKQLNLLGYICLFSVLFTGRIIMFFHESLKSELVVCVISFVIQFLVYILIGTAVAFAAYAPWRKTKSLPEDKPSPN
jgi:predicted transporter